MRFCRPPLGYVGTTAGAGVATGGVAAAGAALNSISFTAGVPNRGKQRSRKTATAPRGPRMALAVAFGTASSYRLT